jgi:asparagine synthase (glutamine-hydrolysing)
MCGITGFLSKNHAQKDLENMTSSLSHRGPDAAGYFYEANNCIGLGHRRLSILDLSTSANQPFYSTDKRYIMVYNGEVYNFNILAKKFSIDTTTSSDTEVILKLYIKIGYNIFNELNGMFAIAIWDTQEKYLLLARDRMGIKPLYYCHNEQELFFGSEIKAITKVVKPKLNYEALSNYLYLGYMPQSYSLYEGIKQLPSGHYAIFKDGNLQMEAFWTAEVKIKYKPTKYESVEVAKKELNRLLHSSVEYRRIADVPLGTFLSGGIDSSTVTAIAQSQSDRPIQTFSIGFKESKFNESEYARQVAHHLGTEHHEFILSENDAISQIENLLDIFDEPFTDSSAIPTLLVSQMARKHVTVALSGDGGDELFLGYGMYNWAKRVNNPILNSLHKPIAQALSLGSSRHKRAAEVFKWKSKERLKSHIFSQEQYLFSQSEIDDLLLHKSAIDISENYEFSRPFDSVEEQSFFDLKNYLKDDLLVKVDRASMHHALEVRVPLLDHRIVEFSLNLEKKYKIKGNITKYLLKEVLYDYVPKKIFDRPKWGFSVPLIKWLKTDLNYLIQDHLDQKSIEQCALVKYENVAELKKRFTNGDEYLYNRLWALILLHKWYKKEFL